MESTRKQTKPSSDKPSMFRTTGLNFFFKPSSYGEREVEQVEVLPRDHAKVVSTVGSQAGGRDQDPTKKVKQAT